MMRDPGAYLASLAPARPIYSVLSQTAMALIPEIDVEDMILVADISIRGAQRQLNQSEMTIKADLERLVKNGWIEKHEIRTNSGKLRPYAYLLGTRLQTSEILLIADLAAEAATGETRLVSRKVLRLPDVRPSAPREAVGFGVGRKWRP